MKKNFLFSNNFTLKKKKKVKNFFLNPILHVPLLLLLLLLRYRWTTIERRLYPGQKLYESKSVSDTSVRDQRAISIADPIFILDMQSVVSRFHKQVRGGTTRIKESRPRKTLINLARRCK